MGRPVSSRAVDSGSAVEKVPQLSASAGASNIVAVNQNSDAFSAASLSKSKLRSCATCAFKSLGLCSDAVVPPGEPIGHIEGLQNLVAVTHAAPPRKMIRHRNDWSDSPIVLCSGMAVCGITTPRGSRQILSIALPGDFVSIGSLLSTSPGYFSESISDVTFRKFSSQQLKSYILQSPTVLEKFMSILSEDRFRINQLVVDIGRKSSGERIARLILNLFARMEKLNATIGNAIEFPLRLNHIAEALGLSSVYASKAIRKLESNGYIEIDHRILRILDFKGLREAAGYVH